MMGYDYRFKYGLMNVMKDGKLGFINPNFDLVIPLKYTGLAYNNIYTNPPY